MSTRALIANRRKSRAGSPFLEPARPAQSLPLPLPHPLYLSVPTTPSYLGRICRRETGAFGPSVFVPTRGDGGDMTGGWGGEYSPPPPLYILKRFCLLEKSWMHSAPLLPSPSPSLPLFSPLPPFFFSPFLSSPSSPPPYLSLICPVFKFSDINFSNLTQGVGNGWLK